MRGALLSLAIAGAIGPAVPTLAFTITRDVDFVAVNQNPFDSGPAYSDNYQKTIALPTNRTDFPAAVFPLIPPTYAEFGGAVTGELDLTFAAQLSTGRLNLSFPVQNQLTIPDGLRIGQSFHVGSAATVTPDGYTQLTSVPVTLFGANGAPHDYLVTAKNSAGAPSLRTSNPGIGAQVDLDIANHNFLYLKGCAAFVGCEDIVKKDLPSLGSTSVTLLSASTAGKVEILPGIPKVSFTESLPKTIPLGTFADFTVNAPNLAQSGGYAGGTALHADKTSNIATLHVSFDGLISNLLLNPLGLPPLSGSVGPVDYSLLKADASLQGGLYQNLDFNGTTKVSLFLDHFVRARVNGQDLGPKTVVSFTPGDDVQLSPLGLVSRITAVPVFGLPNTMHNSTGLALGAELSASALSASAPGIGSIGPLVEGKLPLPLGTIEFYKKDFPVDIKPIAGAPFDINFTNNGAALSVKTTPLAVDQAGRGLLHIQVLQNGAVVSEFDAAGSFITLPVCLQCDITASFFLPDQEVTSQVGNELVDLGDIFCLSAFCNQTFDLSALGPLVHEADVDGFNPVFFADAAPDFQLSDPLLSDSFISHTSANPDPGQLFALDETLYRQLVPQVPEPGSITVLGVGVLGMAASLARRRQLRGAAYG